MEKLISQLVQVIIISAIPQGIFLTLLLNAGGLKRNRANLFLTLLILGLSFSVAHMMFARKVLDHFSIDAHPLGDPSFLIIAPLLWFYVLELTGASIRLSHKLLYHFVPFFVLIFFSLWRTRPFPVAGIHWTAVFFWILVTAQFSIYQFLIQRKLVTYQRMLEQEISYTENVNIGWVRFFMVLFLLVNLFFLFNLFAVIHLDYEGWQGQAIAVVLSLFIYALGYKGILQKQVFPARVAENKTRTPELQEAKQVDERLKEKLLAFMETDKPYLDPELTLTSLAQKLNISRGRLSELINEGMGDNFYNFVNHYRVEQVKKFMDDPSRKNYNLLGLALDAGFKSKSTFNLIFKRFTGLTPTEYKSNRE